MGSSANRQVFETYLTAWSAMSTEERRAVLEQTVSSDIQYFDAMARLSGRDALAAHLAGFQQRRPNYSFSLAHYLQHSDAVLANWLMQDDSGKIVVRGYDSIRLDDFGRIASIVGFSDIPAQSGG
ncbi:nuclear transport factor 2 family protein [Lichenicoccus sp.]|uniref:nuclear transport factor 2 family protein n=1 Tax=Lichenicoccus sp. TaxID=2781899 RepID=UPI003D0A36C2